MYVLMVNNLVSFHNTTPDKMSNFQVMYVPDPDKKVRYMIYTIALWNNNISTTQLKYKPLERKKSTNKSRNLIILLFFPFSFFFSLSLLCSFST